MEMIEVNVRDRGDAADVAIIDSHKISSLKSSIDGSDHQAHPDAASASMPSSADKEDTAVVENEVKVNIEEEAKDEVKLDPPAFIDPSTTVEIPISDEPKSQPFEAFSQEKDVPEVSERVYDFNMVKQKTLQRINFTSGENGILRLCSSQSKTYILTWVVMGLVVLVCTFVLIWYFGT